MTLRPKLSTCVTRTCKLRIPVNVTADSGNVTVDSGDRDRGAVLRVF